MFNLIVTLLLLSGPNAGHTRQIVANHFDTNEACVTAQSTTKIDISGYVRQVSTKCELQK
jgi:hypothetical protein